MSLVVQVAQLRRTVHRLLTRRLARSTERPFPQLLALRVVSLGQVHTQVELAERLMVDGAAVSRLVDRLQGEGLLERRPGEDRRCVKLHVTAAGQREVEALDRELARMDAHLEGHLSRREVDTLHALLAKLQAVVDETPA